jgi:multicomponent Na+:H+ antiporter subunit D
VVSDWLVLPILLPIIGAGLSIITGRSRWLQRLIGLSVLTVMMVFSVLLLVDVDREGTIATQVGAWPAPIGITLVADRFAAIMLVLASLMLLTVLVYAIGQPGAERNHVGFQSVYLILAGGLSATFLVGDLFTLFVAFEVMLTASYVLLTLGARREQVRAGMTYVVISLLSSTLFVTAIALVYSATGTLNLADLAGKMADLPGGVRMAFSVLFLIVFGIKAGLFPLFFWLPDSYPTAPSPVTAVFAGLLTKVGVYAIIRFETLLFPVSVPTTLILVLAGLTMVIGVLGAIAQDDFKRILSFLIISSIGFVVMGLGFFTVAAIAAAIFYIVNHIVVKTALFLTGGLVEHVGGSSRLLGVGNMVRTAPVLAVLFAIPALSLVGVPPFAGFVAKFALVDSGFGVGEYVVVGVSLLASLLTVFSMTKIWSGVFWSPAEPQPDETPPRRHPGGRLGGPILMIVPTAALCAVSLAIMLAAGSLFALSERAAHDLLDPSGYIRAVLG